MTTALEIVRKIASENQVSLSRESVHALADVVVQKKYKKSEYILSEGEVCHCLRYIEKGMTRQFYFKYGKEVTEHIGYEGGVVICLESYLKQIPTYLMIEAIEPVVLWELPKADCEELSLKYSDIGVLYRKFFENSLIESQIKADTLRFEPAHERYNKLFHLHPEIMRRAPLVYVASLLQMTPETLSRVRSASLND